MRTETIDGLLTLFYDGSELWNEKLGSQFTIEYDRDQESWDQRISSESKDYWMERQSWEQVIVVNGVTEIPERTFHFCWNIKRVIFSDTVVRIKQWAFSCCSSLVYVKLALTVHIGEGAFSSCNLSSVFIPPRCREIGGWAFDNNENLTILNVPQDTEVGDRIFNYTELLGRSPFGVLDPARETNTWLKNINNDEQFALHRVCSSFEPTLDMILDAMTNKGGLMAFNVENSIGITPSKYLKENPYAHVSEKEVIEKYVLQMMGEE